MSSPRVLSRSRLPVALCGLAVLGSLAQAPGTAAADPNSPV
ncbi:hypothetical protein [Streptomyces finlayi]|nr:hypothetical protein [Streptomyces finlayi]